VTPDMKLTLSLLFICSVMLSLSGCATTTVQSQRLDLMPDKSVCELLGPEWSSSPEERAILRRELERRGVICDQGRIIAHKRHRYQPASVNRSTHTLPRSPARDNLQGLNAIRLKKASGVYRIPVQLNDAVAVSLILDSGAADLMLTPKVANILIRNGTLTEDDFLPGQVYRLADGSRKKHMRARLRSVTLGKRTFRDVTFSISDTDDSPMLLGQSLLERLGKYTIDYHNGVLLFE
ncbi:MAG: retropepsin-like aspartic protease, partial [Pseudomonadota bacterium]|nr:retropepsin-like aspartic protease [Pseudomonadota bacterium]